MLIPITDIEATAATQIRATLDTRIIEAYAKAMKDGDVFPAIVVFDDGNRKILADGFHRISAAENAGLRSIKCEVHEGGLRDALRYALGANETHGLRRSNKDKRHAIEIALKDPEWSQKNNSEVARLCNVSIPLVRKVRHELVEAEEIPEQDTVTMTRNGQEIERAATNKTKPRNQVEIDRDNFVEFVGSMPPYDGYEAAHKWDGLEVNKVVFLRDWCNEYIQAVEDFEVREMMP